MYPKCIVIVFVLFTSMISAQVIEPTDPRATEDWSRKPPVITGKPLKWEVPSDAVVLLGNSTDQWTKKDGSPIDWMLEDGVLTVKPGTKDIISKASFGDCHLHLEWRSPVVVKGDGQNRGNSGVFLQSRYEIQILDNFNNETYYNGQASALYKQSPPLFNACSKTGEWNTYDIIFSAPKFDKFGNKLASGRVTVIHNGIVTQNNTEILGTTEYIGFPKSPIHGGAPIILQDHDGLVSFRNIWVRRL
ncbi:MAG: DUF1080 domain-containing protein [Saprospiraceae bacterium]|nr:DUF1080 domain-containing protein [Saprospiraceae bacterium]